MPAANFECADCGAPLDQWLCGKCGGSSFVAVEPDGAPLLDVKIVPAPPHSALVVRRIAGMHVVSWSKDQDYLLEVANWIERYWPTPGGA